MAATETNLASTQPDYPQSSTYVRSVFNQSLGLVDKSLRQEASCVAKQTASLSQKVWYEDWRHPVDELPGRINEAKGSQTHSVAEQVRGVLIHWQY